MFFVLGMALYAAVPWAAQLGSRRCSSAFFCVILSMYGGGFATVPAYLADLFGTRMVGAIHGRLLTAWSTAGIIGPVVVNYIREAQIKAGVPGDQVYDYTMYILAGFLAAGFVANFMVRPVAAGSAHVRGGGRRAASQGGCNVQHGRGVVRNGMGAPGTEDCAGLGGGRHPPALGRRDDARQGARDVPVGAGAPGGAPPPRLRGCAAARQAGDAALPSRPRAPPRRRGRRCR